MIYKHSVSFSDMDYLETSIFLNMSSNQAERYSEFSLGTTVSTRDLSKIATLLNFNHEGVEFINQTDQTSILRIIETKTDFSNLEPSIVLDRSYVETVGDSEYNIEETDLAKYVKDFVVEESIDAEILDHKFLHANSKNILLSSCKVECVDYQSFCKDTTENDITVDDFSEIFDCKN